MYSVVFKFRTKRKKFYSRLTERRVLKNPTLQGTQKLETSCSGISTTSAVIVSVRLT